MKSSRASRWSTRAGGGATALTATSECSQPTTWNWCSPVPRATSPPDPTPPSQDRHSGSPGRETLRHSSGSSQLTGLGRTRGAKSSTSQASELLVTVGVSSLSFQNKRFHDVVMLCAKWRLSLATCRETLRLDQNSPTPNVVTHKCDAVWYQSQLKLIFCEH